MHTEGVAGLTYDEVRRASLEASRPLQDMMAHMRSSQNDLRRCMHMLENLTFRVNSMQTQLNVMQTQLNDHSNVMRPVQGSAQQVQVLQNQQSDMMRKMAEMDQVLRACYQYLGMLRQH